MSGAPARRAIVTAALGAAAVLALAAGCRDADERAIPPPPPGVSPVAGIQDNRLGDPAIDPEPRMRRMAELGAALVRVDLRWDRVATRRPADPRRPGDAAYDWRQYDRVVRAANRHGVSVMMTIWGTPRWAADRAVPVGGRFPSSAVRPRDPADVGRFAAAAARRYGPRGVRLWEAWNEPNLPLFLRPQYALRDGGWTAVSPRHYSLILRSVYREIHRVQPSARVGGAVTAPVGDRCPQSCPDDPDDRVTPAAFLEALSEPGNRPPMDAVSHHPYPLSPPRESTPARASYIDLYALDRLRDVLDAGYLRDRPVWLSEVGFATAPTPEYPLSFGEAEQARLLSDAYRRVRAAPGVELVSWYLLQDDPAWRSGLLRRDGSAKPSAAAFSLPAAPTRWAPLPPGDPVRVVGQVRAARPSAGAVTLERREGGRWAPAATAVPGPDGSFAAVVRPRSTGRYRAVWRARAGGAVRVGNPFRVAVSA